MNMGDYCINCKSNQIVRMFDNLDIIGKKRFTYFKCNKCRIIFINPFPSRNRLKEIYSFKTNLLEKNTNPPLFLFYENPLLRPIFNNFGKLVNKERGNFVDKNINIRSTSKTILEIGCGAGRFLLEMKKRGWNIIGQDISDKCINEAKNILGNAELLIGIDIKEYKIFHQTSIIAMWHVFEHMVDFKSVMRHIRNNTLKGVYLIIESPSSSALSLKLFGKYSPLLITPEHITFWSKEGFKEILEDNNYNVINVSYPKTFLFTTTSAAFNYFKNKYRSRFIAFILIPFVFFISCIIYIFIPKYNESIRVLAIKK